MTRWREYAWLLGPIAVVVLAGVVISPAAADSVAGSQGVDTSLPPTDSQVTVRGRDAFSTLAVTVNQTASLTNQAVSITWSGGTPTRSGPGRFGAHYLQIMQCWGDDDGTVPGNPGPPPEQCEQGAVTGTYGGLSDSPYPAGFATTRIISRSDWPNYSPTVGYLDTRTTNVYLPFRAVDGTTINNPTDPTFIPAEGGGNFWLNPYFSIVTTNEVAGAVTGPDSQGAELFQVLNGVQSSGLGCGQKIQPVTGGGTKIPKCWIVVVPRGSAVNEDAGTPYAGQADQSGVVTSPVSPSAWQHRIAIPIDFNPVDSPCALGADERRIAGTQLASPAISSWQPVLCSTDGLPPYSYVPVSDSSARQQLLSGQSGAPGMVVISKPESADAVDPAKPVVYAPLSVSGLTIGFNIERNPTNDAPVDEQQLTGVRVADLQLTPRLVAKLLTQSYTEAVSINSDPGYTWTGRNPTHLGKDPDFLRFNPEFAQLQIQDGRTFSGLQLPAGNSDAAQQVWEWVLADPEASAWLAGQPDDWGMVVNPVYATDAAKNSTGIAFGDPLPNSFPKADPYCYQAPRRGRNNSIIPAPLCGTDWMPYRGSLAQAAQITRTAADTAKIAENPFALTSSDVWKRDTPQYVGRRDMLALTDTPSAALFGVQTAKLSRAGDDGATRTFIAPDTAGLIAGVDSMAPRSEPTVLEPTPTASAPAGYPLTTLSYAAISPLALDEQARAEYAAFLRYAVTEGQVPGVQFGQLPRGYAPLPDALVQRAAQTIVDVVTMTAPVTPTTTVPTTAPPTTSPETTAAPTTTGVIASSPNTTAASTPAAIPTTATPTTVRRVNPTTAAPTPSAPAAIVPSSVDTVATTTPVETTPAAAAATTVAATAVVDQADTPVSSTPAVITPIVNLARSRYAVPGLGVMAVGSALVALEITKRPRRGAAGAPDGAVPMDEIEPV